MSGTEWRVESVASVTDGDTVRLIRSRAIEVDGRAFWLTDREAKGVPIRLVWVDTPERGQDGYSQATADLRAWIGDRSRHVNGGGMRVFCYESAGWDRLLGDLLDADGNSASQWLMTERGWPAYDGGK